MRKLGPVIVIALAALSLGGCGRAGGGVFGNKGPDEFQVARRAPLVIPPDFAMRPPRPGAPRPQEADSSTQALNALFGGQQRVSGGEAALLNSAGRPGEPGMRSEAGDPDTTVVNKGATTRDILNAPVGAGQEASASTPQ
ncbi:DUF3035 domain-containing protein [Sphingomonas jatrophae]|uniref:Beta-barrel assembly machine subunit BamF n=1 Tax=Sphingomonas jatrophae TaxID=1166337 RepID=A0A1I6JPW8_9SPHN|nr:DUF3035 domain-containing protein [Sphingomonas jatrophae]SFR81039.1 Beta-barrel assembly machine subunit BamF [Sphingomonas jatrophae]